MCLGLRAPFSVVLKGHRRETTHFAVSQTHPPVQTRGTPQNGKVMILVSGYTNLKTARHTHTHRRPEHVEGLWQSGFSHDNKTIAGPYVSGLG